MEHQLWRIAFKVAMKYLRNEEDAEDIAQETLAKYFIASSDIIADKQSNWVATVSRRQSLNVLRDQKKQAQLRKLHKGLLTPNEIGRDFEYESDHQLLRKLIATEVSPVFRPLVFDVLTDRYTRIELAERHGIRYSTVDSRLHRARKQLQEAIERMDL